MAEGSMRGGGALGEAHGRETRLLHRGLLEHMVAQSISTIGVNAAAVAGLWVLARRDGPSWMDAWAAAGLGVALLRSLLHLHVKRSLHPSADTGLDRAVGLYVFGLICSALLWAVLALGGYEDLATGDQMALLLIISALAGGATGILAAVRRAGAVYITLLLGAGSTALFLATPSQPVLGALGLAFLLVMLVSHARNHRVLTESLRLGIANAALVDELARQNHELEQRVAERTQALHELAHLDALTGLANRRSIAARDDHQLPDGSTVLFIDLDRFKEINDTRGHAVGDAVLKEVALRLRSGAQGSTTLARWGGDEFVCVRDASGHHSAEATAHALLEAIATPIELEGSGEAVGLTASIGIARAPEHGHTLDTLIAAADLAAMQAKREGKARALVHNEALAEASRRRHAVEACLAEATHDGSLVLHYQPIVDGAGRPRQMEALLRWTPAALGAVSPVEFIPIAEESGHIQRLGRWVLHRACAEAAGWQAEHPGLAVAVNVSMPQLLDTAFFDEVSDALRMNGLAAALLVLEVTEGAFAESRDETVLKTLRALAGLGVRIEVDDFGTGYSSLSRLHLFPLSAIKIDRQFVQALDEPARAVIAAVRLIADRFRLDVIAEGVEDAERAESLKALGADALQGYWFARPAPAAQALASPLFRVAASNTR